ncbi:hypothetical protein Tco_1329213 [Tanacetum coccineum]
MATTAAQQIALDNALVAPEKRICPRLPDQEFDKPPSEEEIISFIKELGHTGKIKNITAVVVDHMHQPRIAFTAIINKCLNEDTQVYGALIPTLMTTPKIQDSPAYQTYLAFATGAATPNTKRIYKKPATPMIKTKTISPEETPSKKKYAPAKKDVSSKNPLRKQLTGVQIRDTPDVSVSKKKVPSTTDTSKGSKLLSDAALLEEAQLKKFPKKSKQETNIYQAGGLSEGVDLESEVIDEPKGKSSDKSEGTGLKPGVLDVSKVDSFESEYESWGDSGDEANEQEFDNPRTSDDKEETQDDEYVHTPEDYVPTDDETNDETNDVDEEEYDRIDRELYGDVNVRLTDAEPDDEDKGDKEMTNAETIDVKHENVIQESAGNQVKDDAQATQKTKFPLHSSSISSDYAAKYLNFDNIPPVDTEVVSMLDINVQHEVPRTSPLLTIPVSIIHEHNVINPPKIVTTASATTISSLLTSLFPHLQQSPPIPTPTTTKATTSTTVVPGSKTLTTLHQRIAYLGKDVKELKDVDNSTKVISTIQSKVLKAIKEYLGSSLDDAMYKQVPKETITSSDTTALQELDQKTTLFQAMTKSKSFNRISKQRALNHELMESILKDEDAMDKGVADKLNKRKPDDVDKDKGPSAGSNRGEKTPATSSKSSKFYKSANDQVVEPISVQDSDNAKHDDADYADMPMDQGEDLGKSIDDGPEQSWLKDMAKATKPPPTFDELMHTPIDFSAFGTCKSYVELDYTMEECYCALSEQLVWNNPEGHRCPNDLTKPQPVQISCQGRQIVLANFLFNNDLEYLRGGSNNKKYTASTTNSKVARYELRGVEDMVPNLWILIKHDVYSTKRILNIISIKVDEWYGYGYLEEIVVKRADQRLYTFKEGDFKRLRLNDIEDMLLLI